MPEPISREIVAEIVRLNLTDAELDRITAQLGKMLDHFRGANSVVDFVEELGSNSYMHCSLEGTANTRIVARAPGLRMSA